MPGRPGLRSIDRFTVVVAVCIECEIIDAIQINFAFLTRFFSFLFFYSISFIGLTVETRVWISIFRQVLKSRKHLFSPLPSASLALSRIPP